MPLNITNAYNYMQKHWNNNWGHDGEMHDTRYHGRRGGYRNPHILRSFACLLSEYAHSLDLPHKVGLVGRPMSGLILCAACAALYPDQFDFFIAHPQTKDDGVCKNAKLKLQQTSSKTHKQLWFIDDDIVTGNTYKYARRLYPGISRIVVWYIESDNDIGESISVPITCLRSHMRSMI